MKKTVGFALGFILLGLAIYVFLPTRPPGAKNPAAASPAERPSPPKKKIEPTTSPSPVTEVKVLLAAQDTAALRQTTARLRVRARMDEPFRRLMVEYVKASHEDILVRDALAFVLGSIPLPDIQWELATLLGVEHSRNPAFARMLLYSLGSDKPPDDDDLFDMPQSTWVIESMSGLHIMARTKLENAPIRQSIAQVIRFSGNSDLRWTAARVLRHSTDFEDVRAALTWALDVDRSTLAQSEYGVALAEWVARSSKDTPEADQVVLKLLKLSRQPESGALRFLLEAPLREIKLTRDEIAAVSTWITQSPDPDVRYWAMNLLALKASQFEPQVRKDTASALLQVLETDANTKLQDKAADLMGRFGSDGRMAPVLIRALQTAASPGVRESAARSLGRMPATQETLTALHTASTTDSHEAVRDAARNSLDAIEKQKKSSEIRAGEQ